MDAGRSKVNPDFVISAQGTVTEYEETYYGNRIRIVTTRAADGVWHSSVTLPDHPEISVEPQARNSEPDAYGAALSAAMVKVDRSRSRVGKL